MKRKFLALLLSFCMALSLLPVSALAASGQPGRQVQSYDVYVYVQFVDEYNQRLNKDDLEKLGQSGLVLNEVGWFTYGVIKNATSVNPQSQSPNSVANSTMVNSVVGQIAQAQRYQKDGETVNQNINLSSSTDATYKLWVQSGATDYADITGTQNAWHLDISIKVTTLSSYTVHYYKQGTDEDNPQKVADDITAPVLIGSQVTEEAKPVEGYAVVGSNKETITIKEDDNENVITFYYQPTQYNITYNLDGGTVDPANPASYTIESDDITLTKPTRTGYTFLGWTGTGLDSASQSVTIPKGSTGDRTYTATWKQSAFNVIYNANNNTNNSVTDNNGGLGYSDTVALKNQNFTYEGYVFLGWSTTENPAVVSFNGTVPELVSEVTVTDADVNVYAVWGEDSNDDGTADVYQTKVTFKVVNGYWGETGENSTDIVKYFTLTGTDNEQSANGSYTLTPADVPVVGNLPADGYVAEGTWATLTGSNTTPVGEQISKSEGTDGYTYTFTYRAQTYTLTYDINGGVADTQPAAVTNLSTGTTATLDNGNTVKHDKSDEKDVVFIGWTTNDAVQDKIYSNASELAGIDILTSVTIKNSNVTVYAVWGEDAKGGSNGGDGIADVYQIFLEFVAEDGGTVSPDADQVITLTNQSTSGAVVLTNNVTATPDLGHVFQQWSWTYNTQTNNSSEATLTGTPKGLDNVTGGTTIVFTASFRAKVTEVKVEKTLTSVGDETDFTNGIPQAKTDNVITWKITVTNTGDAVSGLTLSDTLTDGTETEMTGVTLYEQGSTTALGESYTFSLNDNEAKVFTAQYTIQTEDAGKVLSNSADVYEGDSKIGTDTSEDSVTVEKKDLTVTKSVDTTSIKAGNTLTYTITVTNTGNVALNNITVTDTLENTDGSVTFTASDRDAYKINDDGTVTINTLEANNEVTITATYQVLSADAGKTIRNTATAKADDGTSATSTGVETAISKSSSSHSSKPTTPVTPPVLNTEDHVAYIIGYEDGTVRPANNITRAEVATIFFRLLTDESRAEIWSTTNDYSDVAGTAWYNNAISTLSNAGIITGYEDGTFRPDASITRAEFATIAARFSDVVYDGSNGFTDVPDTHWAARYIALAQHLGWINGYEDNTFRPEQSITRAESMTLINRVLERAVDEDHMLSDMVTWRDNPSTAWYYEAVQEATNSHEYTRTNQKADDQSFCYESWQKILPVRDWAAFEQAWASANAAAD